MGSAQNKKTTALSLIVATALLGLQPAYGDEVTRAWLDRMGRAIQELSYHGEFVHSDSRHSRSMGIVHRVDDGTVHERLWSLDGPDREFIRKENELTCILSDNQEVVVDHVDPDSSYGFPIPKFTQALHAFYSLRSHDAEEKIAGRLTQKIDILPQDRYRYGYTLWLDVETAMPLRSDLVATDGDSLEQTYFINIDYRDGQDIQDSELDPALPVEGYEKYIRRQSEETANQNNPMVNWSVAWLPPGFYLTSSSMDPTSDGKGALVHLVYSDGLATVSVFVEPIARDNQDVLRGLSPDMHAFGASAQANGSEYQVIVMGEVPGYTLQTMGESVQFSAQR